MKITIEETENGFLLTTEVEGNQFVNTLKKCFVIEDIEHKEGDNLEVIHQKRTDKRKEAIKKVNGEIEMLLRRNEQNVQCKR